MNTILSTAPGRHDHPPQPDYDHTVQPARRVRPLDLLALRVGVALIRWGRRPHPIESREHRANHIEQHRARLERERVAERALRLTVPLR